MDKYALIGFPLSHSFSPLIHNKAFTYRKINAKYELLEVKEDELENVIELLRNNTYKGFNVTIPYKEKIMKYLDEISIEAKSIGAVNTIAYKNGKVIGYNTDYYGFIEELKYENINVSNKICYILGTGGASKAVYKALLDLNAKPVYVSRTCKENAITYDNLDVYKDDIIVNTTPIGMYPNINHSVIDKELASKAYAIVDIIFNPLKTKLMSYNDNSYNGLLMLIFQALKAEEIWFGDEFLDVNRIINEVRGELDE